MAYIKSRKRADGGTSYSVHWVIGGGRAANGGGTASETFTSENRAKAFKLDVENADHQWPPGWVKGQGYVQVEPEKAAETLGDVANSYFEAQERMIKRGRLTAHTLYRYRRSYALHIEPALGGLDFASIEEGDIEDWVDVQIETPYEPKSVRNQHGLLFSIMAHGQKRMKLRHDNPCELTTLPEVNASAARQIRFFQHGEWELFRSCLKEDVLLLVEVLLATGMRWGEVSALRVGDIAFDESGAATIHILRAWSSRSPFDESKILTEEHETKAFKVKPPKNRRSRYVVISNEVADRLRKHVEGVNENRYVFVSNEKKNIPWRYPEFHKHRWAPARDAAAAKGLKKHATPHMLRHTTVVWSLEGGVRIQVVSEMLGHSSIQITYDTYGGLINLQDPIMSQAMSAAMARGGDQSSL